MASLKRLLLPLLAGLVLPNGAYALDVLNMRKENLIIPYKIKIKMYCNN